MRALSRRAGSLDGPAQSVIGDLTTGEGLAAAVDGVDAVVHAATDPRSGGSTDVEGTRRLVQAARMGGVSHLVFVSIVGIDRIPLPYYRHKLAAERVVADSGVPHSILRITQFHYFVDLLLQRLARTPLLLPIPVGFRIQSIGTPDVARELLDVAASSPRGRCPDLAGPEVMGLAHAARLWRDILGVPRWLVPLPLLGRTAAALRAGHNTVPDRPRGTETWRDWLEERAAVGAVRA